MRCRSCHAENPADAAFCGACGETLGISCERCGRENPAQSRYCHGCGAQLREAAEAPAASGGDGWNPPRSLASGRYQLGELLGQGTTKRAYRARDQRLDREVAIAFVRVDDLDDDGRLRLERETQAMGRLGDHPNIVTVHDIFETGSMVAIVTQLMEAGDLESHIRSAPDGRLPWPEALRIGKQIASALEHAHSSGIVHRDLKPGNIWLSHTGDARLGDFGLALALDRSRVTATGMLVGTAAYMPPEQALGKRPDARSDLYAFGATLYHMLTGRPPFTGDDTVAVISQHLHTPPVAPRWADPKIPEALEGLVLRLLAKDPEARGADATEVRERLEELARAATPTSSDVGPASANPLDRLAGGVFVGREDEVETLRAALDSSLSGRARVVLLVGEPGIGKTRTAEELGTYARMRGATVFWGRCHEGDGAPAFWPWIQILRQWLSSAPPEDLARDLGTDGPEVATVLPEVRQTIPGLDEPSPLEPEQARFRLFDALCSVLRRATRRAPLVVMLDDLHWADEPSLLLLQFLVSQQEQARLLVVGSYRDVELRRQHPLSRTLAELTRMQVADRILLRGLDRGQVARFIEQSACVTPAPELIEAVYRQTEGNPFFVHEVVRLLTSENRLKGGPSVGIDTLEIPEGVREVVGRRLSQLSDCSNDLLRAASVIGREFDVSWLARLVSHPEEKLLPAIDEALAARIVHETDRPGRLRFSHAVIKETLYEELSTPKRVDLHRRAGEGYLEIYGDRSGPHLAEIAHHLFQSVQAGEPERAIEALRRAADWARSRQAWEETTTLLDRAVQVAEIAPGCDGFEKARLLVELAEASVHTHHPERSRVLAERAIEAARGLAEPDLLVRAVLARGGAGTVVEIGRVDEAMVGLLEECLDRLGKSPDALRVEVLCRLIQELNFSADWERRETLHREVTAMALDLGEPALEARVLLTETFRPRLDSWHVLAAKGRRVLELAEQVDSPILAQGGWTFVFLGSLWNGDREGAESALRESRRLVERIRTPFLLQRTEMQEITFDVLSGRHQRAQERIDRAEASRETGLPLQGTGGVFFVSLWQRGVEVPPERAEELVELYPKQIFFRGFRMACWASIPERREDAVRELLSIAAAGFGPVDNGGSPYLTLLLIAADACDRLGITEPVADLRRRLAPSSGHFVVIAPGAGCHGPVDLRLAALARLDGELDLAETLYRSAIEACERLGAGPWEGQARLGLARTLAAGGRATPDQVLAELAAAQARIVEYDLDGFAETATALRLALQERVGAGDTIPMGSRLPRIPTGG